MDLNHIAPQPGQAPQAPQTQWLPADRHSPIFSAKFQLTPAVIAQDAAGVPAPITTFLKGLADANRNGKSVVWANGTEHAYFLRSIVLDNPADVESPSPTWAHLYNHPTVKSFETALGKGTRR